MLKPNDTCINIQAKGKEKNANIVKAHAAVHKCRRQEVRTNTWILTPRRPSDRDSGLPKHIHAAWPRPHTRHAQHERDENEVETRPLSRLQGSHKPD